MFLEELQVFVMTVVLLDHNHFTCDLKGALYAKFELSVL